MDAGAQALRQHARDIFDETAPGDVGQALDQAWSGLDQRQKQSQVGAVRRQQGIRQAAAQFGHDAVQIGRIENLAQQRIAVGMRPVG